MLKRVISKFPLMINCNEAESFMLNYLEDDLTRKQKFVFEMHLKMCKECRAYLKAYKQTIALGKAAFDDPNAPVPHDFPEDLITAILEARVADNTEH